MQLTFEGGNKIRRLFCADISNEEELQKFVEEVRFELSIEQKGRIIFCEIWKAYGFANALVHREKEVEVQRLAKESEVIAH